MLKDVTVEHEGFCAAGELLEADQDLHAPIDQNHILPACFLRPRRLAIAAQHPENGAMNVKRVGICRLLMSQISVAPSLASASMRPMMNGLPLMLIVRLGSASVADCLAPCMARIHLGRRACNAFRIARASASV